MLIKNIGDIPDSFERLTASKKPKRVICYRISEECDVEIIDGIMKANKGDYIICFESGRMMVAQPETFNEVYDIIEVNRETRELRDVFKIGDQYTVTKDSRIDNEKEFGFYVHDGFPTEILDTKGAEYALKLIEQAWNRSENSKTFIH